MKQEFKSIRTVLQPGQYLPKNTDLFRLLFPYRNSNSPEEGLTIPFKELRKFAPEGTSLDVGTRLEIAVVVDGMDELPIVQAHINKRGGYITGPVCNYHEKMGHLPAERIKMGDRRRKSDYSIKVSSILFLSGAVELNAISEALGHIDSLTTEAYANCVEKTEEQSVEVTIE